MVSRVMIVLARVFRKVDHAILRINHYLMDSVVCFVNIYPVDSIIQPSTSVLYAVTIFRRFRHCGCRCNGGSGCCGG